MTKKVTLLCVCVLTLMGALLTKGFSTWPDPEIDAAIVRLVSGATVPFKLLIDSSGNLAVTENKNLNQTVLRVGAGAGGILPFSRTTLQFQSLTPDASGQIVVNISKTPPSLCISTGTGIASFVYVSSFNAGVQSQGTAALINCGI